MRHNPEAREKPQVAIEAVRDWNLRKRRNLKPEHLLKAWQRLKEQGWNPLPASA